MANYPINIWVIDENSFDEYVFSGGKVVYIVEEPDQKYAMHPAIITAGALLPPIDAIQAELNGDLFQANMIYENYLQMEEADPYISILIAAGIQQTPIGIMFGKDELNMHFPTMLLDFVYKYYGLVFGIKGSVQPYIEEPYMPIDLAKLYMMNIIDYPTFITKHPILPIHQSVISKLAYDVNPLVDKRDFEHYVEYFERIKKQIIENGGRYLEDPLIGAEM